MAVTALQVVEANVRPTGCAPARCPPRNRPPVSDRRARCRRPPPAQGYADVIEVVYARAEDVELSEPADVLVSEWMARRHRRRRRRRAHTRARRGASKLY